MTDVATVDRSKLLTLTVDIVAAHVSANAIAAADVPALIASVHGALAGLGRPADPADVPVLKPAVAVRASIKPDYLVCLEDGKQFKMLKRHLMKAYGLTPDEYRAKWNLPADYPMVAPAYAAKRSMMAKANGLGLKTRMPEGPDAPAAAEAKGKRGRVKSDATPAAAAPVRRRTLRIRSAD